MSPEATAAASDLLFDLWSRRARIAAVPEGFRPNSRAEGYAVQARLEARSAVPILGWKIAATSVAGQRHINVDSPILGRLLAERAFASGDRLVFGDSLMKVAECEFCFRMGATLAPRPEPFSVDEVVAAVAALHLAIEVPDSRFEDFTLVGAPQLIADNACAHEFVLGPEVTADWRAADLAAHSVAGHVDGRFVREGRGANVLGDPRIALAFAANELRGLGLPLLAGQIVTTGTCIVPLEIEPGARVRGDFGSFGAVEATLV